MVFSAHPLVLAVYELQSPALLRSSLSSPSLLSADFCFYGMGHPSAQLWGSPNLERKGRHGLKGGTQNPRELEDNSGEEGKMGCG